MFVYLYIVTSKTKKMIKFILKTFGIIAFISIMTYFFGGIVLLISSIIGGFWFGGLIADEHHKNFMINWYVKNRYKDENI